MSKAPVPETPGADDAWARDRLAAVGSIASLIGHEARNRLALLRAALELLQAGLEENLSPEFRATLLRELDEFIGDFNLGLDMVGCECGATEQVSIRAVVADAIGLIGPVAARAGIRIQPHFGHTVDAVQTDRRLFRLVLLNLLRNATEALSGTAGPRIDLRTTAADGWLYLEIEDNGPGVPAEKRERLFLRRPSDDEGSAGLGLSLCRDAMVVLRGSVRHVTPPGRPGACFRVSLPVGKN